jgi:hypothetical protein
MMYTTTPQVRMSAAEFFGFLFLFAMMMSAAGAIIALGSGLNPHWYIRLGLVAVGAAAAGLLSFGGTFDDAYNVLTSRWRYIALTLTLICIAGGDIGMLAGAGIMSHA